MFSLSDIPAFFIMLVSYLLMNKNENFDDFADAIKQVGESGIT